MGECLNCPLDILEPPPAALLSINTRLLGQRGANRFKFSEVKDMNLPQELHGSAALRGMLGRRHSQITAKFT